MRHIKAVGITVLITALWYAFFSLPNLHAQPATSCDLNGTWSVVVNGQECLRTPFNSPNQTCFPYGDVVPQTFTFTFNPNNGALRASAPAPEDSTRIYTFFSTTPVGASFSGEWNFPLFRSAACGGTFAGIVGGFLTGTLSDCNTIVLDLNDTISTVTTGIHEAPPNCNRASGVTITGTVTATRASGVPTPPPLTLVDPVPQLLSGPQITPAATAANAAPGQPYLADLTKGREVQGVATDGVAQVVIRIPAESVGEQFALTIRQDQCTTLTTSGCIEEYGLVFDPTRPPSDIFGNPPALSPTVMAVNTVAGPMAFAAYRAPADFVRSGAPNASDQTAAQRSVFITINSVQNGSSTDLAIQLVRPPVILIHGTFSKPSVFYGFSPLVPTKGASNPDPRFFITTLDYSQDISFRVTHATPDYPVIRVLLGVPVRRNVVGIAYNAPLLLKDLVTRLDEFKRTNPFPVNIPVAAVQADIVAHSLGGLMARGMKHVGTTFPGKNSFYESLTYGTGYIHKLVTLGTPHLGTNLALRTLDGTNECVRRLSALNGSYNFNSVRINGKNYPGAASDQQGDPTRNILSLTLQFLNQPRFSGTPTAFIAAQFDSSNDSPDIASNGVNVMLICGTRTEFFEPDGTTIFRIGDVPCGGLPCIVIPGDFLADNYSFSNWSNIFNNQANDVIVPVMSATFGQPITPLTGVVHGPGTVGSGPITDPHIGFAGPQLLDPASGASTDALQLLNTSVKDTSHFVDIP